MIDLFNSTRPFPGHDPQHAYASQAQHMQLANLNRMVNGAANRYGDWARGLYTPQRPAVDECVAYFIREGLDPEEIRKAITPVLFGLLSAKINQRDAGAALDTAATAAATS